MKIMKHKMRLNDQPVSYPDFEDYEEKPIARHVHFVRSEIK